MHVLWVDYDFLETLGINLSAGRGFSTRYSTDAIEAVIINHTASKLLGWKSPAEAIGKSIVRDCGPTTDDIINGTVIGVVEDFHFKSFHSKIEPLAVYIWPWHNYILVDILNGHSSEVLSFLKSKWGEFQPNHPFEYFYLDENFNRFYREEERLYDFLGSMSLLGISLACLGLFGLSYFIVERRKKEIAIRKVLGASFTSIAWRLYLVFANRAFVANLIGWPIAYYAMKIWMQDFAYRIDLSIQIFLICGVVTLLIALFTVSYSIVKSAIANPAETMRFE